MKNIVGTPATGDNFFSRETEIAKILERINADNNLQIAAPRRIGKTSLLHFLKDHQVGGHIYVYVDTEDVYSEQDFFKKLLKTILKEEQIHKSGILRTLVQEGERFFRKIKSIKVMGNGIDFNEESSATDYYEEITHFLSGLKPEGGKKVVLLIDEFPQTILNIIAQNKGDIKAAISFLQSNRRLRQMPELLGRVQFVYTGSIGLNHTVSAINASAFVNDLNTTEVDPLTVEEAAEMIQDLLKEKAFALDAAGTDYLLRKIKWLIPFHIQLAMQELSMQCRNIKIAGNKEIDQAFDQMVAIRNNNHFDHYYRRLKSQFKDNERKFAESVLERIANNDGITKAEIYDLAVKFDMTDSSRQIIEVLMYDGYIHRSTNDTYHFNSPVLQIWWTRFIIK